MNENLSGVAAIISKWSLKTKTVADLLPSFSSGVFFIIIHFFNRGGKGAWAGFFFFFPPHLGT